MTSNPLSDDSKIRYLNLTNVPSEVDWRGKAVSKVKIFTILRFKIKGNAVDVGPFPQLEPWRDHMQWLVMISRPSQSNKLSTAVELICMGAAEETQSLLLRNV